MGDMSLVGPRPLLKEYLKLYNTEQRKDMMFCLELLDGHRLMEEMIYPGKKSLI